VLTVHAAQLLDRLGHERRHVLLGAHVDGDDGDARARLLALLGHCGRLGVRGLQVGDHDVEAVAREALRDRRADALRRASHNRDLAVGCASNVACHCV
jgi:hypothetical protein